MGKEVITWNVNNIDDDNINFADDSDNYGVDDDDDEIQQK